MTKKMDKLYGKRKFFSETDEKEKKMKKKKEKTGVIKKESKFVTVTDAQYIWGPCYPNNQVEVSICITFFNNRHYGKIVASGMDDFGVEIEFTAYDREHLFGLYDHFKYYIYDKIIDGVNLEWFYEHGFLNF